jgi:hypothetical protein
VQAEAAAAKAALEAKEDEEAMARGFIAIVRHLRAHATAVDSAMEAERQSKALEAAKAKAKAKANVTLRADSEVRQPKVEENNREIRSAECNFQQHATNNKEHTFTRSERA